MSGLASFAVGQEVIVSNPEGRGSQHFKGLRARVLAVAPRTVGLPGAVHHVSFLDAALPINDNYFDTEELSATEAVACR
jgi:hypothetical protein